METRKNKKLEDEAQASRIGGDLEEQEAMAVVIWTSLQEQCI